MVQKNSTILYKKSKTLTSSTFLFLIRGKKGGPSPSPCSTWGLGLRSVTIRRWFFPTFCKSPRKIEPLEGDRSASRWALRELRGLKVAPVFSYTHTTHTRARAHTTHAHVSPPRERLAVDPRASGSDEHFSIKHSRCRRAVSHLRPINCARGRDRAN